MMTQSLKWWLFAKTTLKQCSAYFISIKWMWFYLMNTISQKSSLWFFSWVFYLTPGYQMPLFWLYTYVICLNFNEKIKLKNRVWCLKIKAEQLFEVGIKDLWKKKILWNGIILEALTFLKRWMIKNSDLLW